MKIRTLSAGVVVVRKERDEWRFLLLRAYGYWDFPKGIVEEGEVPLDTARREVTEETTLRDLDFPWGLDYRESEPYSRGKVARYYIAETREAEVSLPVSPELGRPEHDEFRWVTYEEATAMVAARVLPILRWAREVTAGVEDFAIEKRPKVA
jgi:8-oxo-dGTP pyrophosphatase MutT (NUDIX family)